LFGVSTFSSISHLLVVSPFSSISHLLIVSHLLVFIFIISLLSVMC